MALALFGHESPRHESPRHESPARGVALMRSGSSLGEEDDDEELVASVLENPYDASPSAHRAPLYRRSRGPDPDVDRTSPVARRSGAPMSPDAPGMRGRRMKGDLASPEFHSGSPVFGKGSGSPVFGKASSRSPTEGHSFGKVSDRSPSTVPHRPPGAGPEPPSSVLHAAPIGRPSSAEFMPLRRSSSFPRKSPFGTPTPESAAAGSPRGRRRRAVEVLQRCASRWRARKHGKALLSLWPSLSALKALYLDEAALAAGAGDNPLYSDEAIVAREALRSAPLVVDALEYVAEACLGPAAENNVMGREAYLAMSRKLYLVLRMAGEEELDPAECARLMERDWAADSAGRGFIERRQVVDAWFQLADLHTLEVSASQYAEWLRKTLDDIVALHAGAFGHGLRIWEWRPDGEIIAAAARGGNSSVDVYQRMQWRAAFDVQHKAEAERARQLTERYRASAGAEVAGSSPAAAEGAGAGAGGGGSGGGGAAAGRVTRGRRRSMGDLPIERFKRWEEADGSAMRGAAGACGDEGGGDSRATTPPSARGSRRASRLDGGLAGGTPGKRRLSDERLGDSAWLERRVLDLKHLEKQIPPAHPACAWLARQRKSLLAAAAKALEEEAAAAEARAAPRLPPLPVTECTLPYVHIELGTRGAAASPVVPPPDASDAPGAAPAGASAATPPGARRLPPSALPPDMSELRPLSPGGSRCRGRCLGTAPPLPPPPAQPPPPPRRVPGLADAPAPRLGATWSHGDAPRPASARPPVAVPDGGRPFTLRRAAGEPPAATLLGLGPAGAWCPPRRADEARPASARRDHGAPGFYQTSLWHRRHHAERKAASPPRGGAAPTAGAATAGAPPEPPRPRTSASPRERLLEMAAPPEDAGLRGAARAADPLARHAQGARPVSWMPLCAGAPKRQTSAARSRQQTDWLRSMAALN